MKKNILLSILLGTLITLSGCGSSDKEDNTKQNDETENTIVATTEEYIEPYSSELTDNDNDIKSTMVTAFNHLGGFDKTVVNYFEDINTFVIIPMFSNANAFDSKFLSGNWNNTVNEYCNIISVALCSAQENFSDANYIVAFSAGNEEMTIPGLVFYNDKLVFDYYSEYVTPQEKNAYIIRTYLWLHPEDDTKNIKIEYDFSKDNETIYKVFLWGKNFNKNSIKTPQFDSVIDNACILSSNLLKLISYNDSSAKIELAIMDGKNHTIKLLGIEDYKVTYNYLNDAETSEDFNEDKEKYESGTYKVGDDIPAGEYVLFGNYGFLSVESDILKDQLGIILDSQIYTDSFKSNSIITVENGQYFTFHDSFAIPASLTSVDTSDDGFFRVGTDLPAGKYKLEQLDEYAKYTIYSDDVASSMNIISESDVEGRTNIEINDGEYLKLDHCKIVQ